MAEMTITPIIHGDILTPNYEEKSVLVCHQVNCMGVMGSGLAKQVKETFPYVYHSYKSICRTSRDRLGIVDIVSCPTHGYAIASIFGQFDYGRAKKRYTDYLALDNAFEYLARNYNEYTLRIPMLMGCCRGGGDWDYVLEMIEKDLVDKGVKVEIWELDRG